MASANMKYPALRRSRCGWRPCRDCARGDPRGRARPRLPRELHAEADAVEASAMARTCISALSRQNARQQPDLRRLRSLSGLSKRRSTSPPASCLICRPLRAGCPSPVSYLRPGPHHWSCGYAAFGVQNREATIRVCPSPIPTRRDAAQAFNLELRPPMQRQVLIWCSARWSVRASRHSRKLPLPPMLDRDPGDSDAERKNSIVAFLPRWRGARHARADELQVLDAPTMRGLRGGEAQGDRDVPARTLTPCASDITMPIEDSLDRR